MKAILLAAGKSSRITSKINNIPKPLIEINGKPILQYNIEMLKRYGIDDLIINTHYKKESIKERFGNGNKFGDSEEGFFKSNVIATYLHGPLLSKNPELADYIIKYCLDRKYDENVVLEPMNDEFENLCREQLLNRFLNQN